MVPPSGRQGAGIRDGNTQTEQVERIEVEVETVRIPEILCANRAGTGQNSDCSK